MKKNGLTMFVFSVFFFVANGFAIAGGTNLEKEAMNNCCTTKLGPVEEAMIEYDTTEYAEMVKRGYGTNPQKFYPVMKEKAVSLVRAAMEGQSLGKEAADRSRKIRGANVDEHGNFHVPMITDKTHSSNVYKTNGTVENGNGGRR
jgi:hypothetical protein